nr:hypothetical protein [Tanacetum cinerariifolium]
MEGMVLGTDGKQVIPRRSTRLNPSLTTSVSHSYDVNVKVVEPSVVVDDESQDHLGDNLKQQGSAAEIVNNEIQISCVGVFEQL